MTRFHLVLIAVSLFTAAASGHSWKAGEAPVFDEACRARMLAEWKLEHGGKHDAAPRFVANGSSVHLDKAPPQAAPFVSFAPGVGVKWDNDFLYVESNGLPSHGMMVGITSWQQQVPLPQNYTGDNAWRVPLHPVPSKTPVSIRGRFLRGAIALAANGIPIFNPQNNRGEVSTEIGELDQWGGHCGRADDYHYHAAPLHLQSAVGNGLPIAYALDGYPIYGLTEPDDSPHGKLDEFNGHETATAGYHYHASTKYPYVNGGFHGEITEREQQVDPQPRANPVRQDQPPLRGAKITNFTTSADGKVHSLQYMIGSKKGEVSYADLGGGSWKFQFVTTEGSEKEETYQARERRGGGPGSPRPREGGGGERNRRGGPADPRSAGPEEQEVASQFGPDAMKRPVASFVLTSPEVADGGNLPADYTGDGNGTTPPLAWKGAPAGTKSYALIMDHLAPGNVMKSYWVVWDIPAGTTSLPKNVQGIGKVGTSFKGLPGYEPPHSQGPGAKTYVLTIYALSARLEITRNPLEVNRDVLLAAMKDKVLASASLNVIYTRSGKAPNDRQRPPRRDEDDGVTNRQRPLPQPATPGFDIGGAPLK